MTWKDYELESGEVVTARSNSCLFCKYCTDLFYDWGGIYLTVCSKDLDIVKGAHGECSDFEEG